MTLPFHHAISMARYACDRRWCGGRPHSIARHGAPRARACRARALPFADAETWRLTRVPRRHHACCRARLLPRCRALLSPLPPHKSMLLQLSHACYACAHRAVFITFTTAYIYTIPLPAKSIARDVAAVMPATICLPPAYPYLCRLACRARARARAHALSCSTLARSALRICSRACLLPRHALFWFGSWESWLARMRINVPIIRRSEIIENHRKWQRNQANETFNKVIGKSEKCSKINIFHKIIEKYCHQLACQERR